MLNTIDRRSSSHAATGRARRRRGRGHGRARQPRCCSPRAGLQVTVVEKAARPGGKLREVDGRMARASTRGPTVFTMRWVFDAIFAAVGARLDDHLTLDTGRHPRPPRLGRTARPSTSMPTRAASADAMAGFAGAGEAHGYRAFCKRTAEVFQALNAVLHGEPGAEPDRPGARGRARRPARRWRASSPSPPLGKVIGTLFPRPAPAPAVRPLRHLLRLLALSTRRAR